MGKRAKIYTRGGDEGMTSLIGGSRVSKHHVRMDTIGAVDESNAAIGLARLHLQGEEDAMLERIQHDLFDLGADIAAPFGDEKHKDALRIDATQVARLESEIDRMDADLQPLTAFVLPGGSAASAHLHTARGVVRRAERCLAALAHDAATNPEALRYLNRLSDHLFTLARRCNANGADDMRWKQGVNR